MSECELVYQLLFYGSTPSLSQPLCSFFCYSVSTVEEEHLKITEEMNSDVKKRKAENDSTEYVYIHVFLGSTYFIEGPNFHHF